MAMADVTIRAATAADVPLILAFIRGLAEYERLLDQCQATEAALHGYLFGERPYAEVIIAEEGGVAGGFALFFHNFSTFLSRPGIYLEDLFVLPERRGHGLGKALLVRLAQLAVERGCGRLEWSVLDWNEPSIGFYQRLGARMMDQWTTCRINGAALAALAGETG